jgi:hypothetical protein
MKAVAALVAAAVVLLVVGFFVPLFPQTTTKDYIVTLQPWRVHLTL